MKTCSMVSAAAKTRLARVHTKQSPCRAHDKQDGGGLEESTAHGEKRYVVFWMDKREMVAHISVTISKEEDLLNKFGGNVSVRILSQMKQGPWELC